MTTLRLFFAHFRLKLAAIFASRRAVMLVLASAVIMPWLLSGFGRSLDYLSPESIADLLSSSCRLFFAGLIPFGWGVLMARNTSKGVSSLGKDPNAIATIPAGRRLRLAAESVAAMAALAVSCLPAAAAMTALDIAKGVDAPSIAESVSKEVELLFFAAPMIVIASNRSIGIVNSFLQLLVTALAFGASCTHSSWPGLGYSPVHLATALGLSFAFVVVPPLRRHRRESPRRTATRGRIEIEHRPYSEPQPLFRRDLFANHILMRVFLVLVSLAIAAAVVARATAVVQRDVAVASSVIGLVIAGALPIFAMIASFFPFGTRALFRKGASGGSSRRSVFVGACGPLPLRREFALRGLYVRALALCFAGYCALLVLSGVILKHVPGTEGFLNLALFPLVTASSVVALAAGSRWQALVTFLGSGLVYRFTEMKDMLTRIRDWDLSDSLPLWGFVLPFLALSVFALILTITVPLKYLRSGARRPA